MDALAALYPSATGGSGATISPLYEPVAAPAAAPAVAPAAQPAAAPAAAPAAHTSSPERRFTELSDKPDPDDPGRYLPLDGQDGDTNEHEESDHDEPAERADIPVEQPVIDTRERIENALRDIRDTEPAATSTTDLNAVTSRYPDGVTPYPAEREQALDAFVHAGIGVSAAGALWTAGMAALKQPIATNQAGAIAALGDNADATVAAARTVVAKASTKYPGLKDFLNRTGLGNDPGVIRYLASKAKN